MEDLNYLDRTWVPWCRGAPIELLQDKSMDVVWTAGRGLFIELLQDKSMDEVWTAGRGLFVPRGKMRTTVCDSTITFFAFWRGQLSRFL